MKTTFCILAVFFMQGAFCFALTPQEQQGLRNITAWAIEQQAQLQKAQATVSDLGNENATLTLANATLMRQEEEKAKEATENAKERDSMLILFAIAFAAWAGTLFGGIMLREFPFPWGLIGVAAAYAAALLFAYAIGRLVVANLAHLIP